MKQLAFVTAEPGYIALVKLTVVQNYSMYFHIIMFCAMTPRRPLAGTGYVEEYE